MSTPKPATRSTAPTIAELRALFNGRVLAPGDPGFDSACHLFYGGFDRHPLAVIRAADAGDVARVVKLAADAGLELAIRSGGHSMAGHSLCDGGLVLDLSALKALSIDPVQRTAWAETGLTAGEFTSAVGAHGLALGFGDTGSVGIGGITLGGGIGFLTRKYGLTIDNLLAAEVVTANGELLHVDADNHPDLFWAMRGGGGNFGVATRFLYRLHPVDMIYGGMLFLPATPETIAGFIAAAEAAPDELTTIANVMPCPPMPMVPGELVGKLAILSFIVYSGPVEQGEQAVAPFRSLATPLADMLHPMHYPEMFPPEEEGYQPTAVGLTMFLDHVDLTTAATICRYLEASDAPMRVAQLRVLGGAAARIPADATPYAHRQARILANVAAFYTGPDDLPVRKAWVDQFAADIQQGEHGAYVNFLGDEGEQRVRAAYPTATWQRLVEIKQRYDPANLFHHNQNIPPAA